MLINKKKHIYFYNVQYLRRTKYRQKNQHTLDIDVSTRPMSACRLFKLGADLSLDSDEPSLAQVAVKTHDTGLVRLLLKHGLKVIPVLHSKLWSNDKQKALYLIKIIQFQDSFPAASKWSFKSIFMAKSEYTRCFYVNFSPDLFGANLCHKCRCWRRRSLRSDFGSSLPIVPVPW